ncbi:MAG: arsenate reductase family protein [Bacillota bacterium]
MRILFVEYPKCTTCKKAKQWLQDQGMDVEARHIVENVPTVDELRAWHKKSGLPLKRFFNTSGLVYKENQLKDKLPTMSEEEQLQLLSGNGMLIKRPIVVSDSHVFVGFKAETWEQLK